jgi:serine/threonine protein kinase
LVLRPSSFVRPWSFVLRPGQRGLGTKDGPRTKHQGHRTGRYTELESALKPRAPSQIDGTRRFSGAIPLDEAITTARQIVDALEAVYDRGVVHRDLRPANIKITPDGNVKVLDFGLAKAMEAAATTGPVGQV